MDEKYSINKPDLEDNSNTDDTNINNTSNKPIAGTDDLGNFDQSDLNDEIGGFMPFNPTQVHVHNAWLSNYYVSGLKLEDFDEETIDNLRGKFINVNVEGLLYNNHIFHLYLED